MKIVIAGSSGLIGRALVPALRGRGHEVMRLVRRPAEKADEISWKPEVQELDLRSIEGVEAVINLAGENIAGGRWTAARRARILGSRVDATRTLVMSCARLQRKPAVFINASAVGYYGDGGDAELTESSPAGLGFLAETCLVWETNAEGAARAGVRTVLLRFGMVLAREGGALAKMLPIFRWGLGGEMGAGTQWTSWVSLTDAVGAMLHVLEDEQCVGALNVVAPQAVTNAEFTATLARMLQRPAIVPVPAWLLRVVFGEMARATIMASARAIPVRLRAVGFKFEHATLEPGLRAMLTR